jgi:hypothetical protein
MATTTTRLVRQIATRAVVAAIPVAMASAYASGLFIQPPRLAAALEYQPVAEITVAPTTIGVATSPLYGQTKAQIEAQLDDMLEIGVTSIRVFVPWGLVEQVDDSYDWHHIDDIMSAAAARNMGVMAEVNATPGWAAATPTPWALPGSQLPDVAQFSEFMRDLVTRYRGTVSAYEIWNEPNYIMFSNPMNPEAYVDLLKAVYPIIKDPVTGDPTATVVAGALGAAQDDLFGRTMSPVTFLQRMLDAGAGDFFDALSIHPYGEEQKFSGVCALCAPWVLTPRQQVETMMSMLSGKQVWITEYGLPTTPGGPFTEADQAAWIKDLLDTWQTYGGQYGVDLGPIFLYTGRDTAVSGTDPEAFRGLWDVNGNLKPAAAMLKAWIEAHLAPQTPQQSFNPFAQFFAALQQISQSFSQALANFFNPGMFIQSFVNAISNLFGFLRPPAPAASVATLPLIEPEVPVAARVSSSVLSSMVGPESAEEAVVSVASEVQGEPVAVELTPAVETAVAPAVDEVVAEPVIVTTPAVAEPAAVVSPEPAAGDAAASDESDPTVKPAKPSAADKPDKLDKLDKPDVQDSKPSGESSRPSKDKGDNDTSVTRVTPKAGSDGAGADKGSESNGAPSSQGGNGSGGGGDEG